MNDFEGEPVPEDVMLPPLPVPEQQKDILPFLNELLTGVYFAHRIDLESIPNHPYFIRLKDAEQRLLASVSSLSTPEDPLTGEQQRDVQILFQCNLMEPLTGESMSNSRDRQGKNTETMLSRLVGELRSDMETFGALPSSAVVRSFHGSRANSFP